MISGPTPSLTMFGDLFAGIKGGFTFTDCKKFHFTSPGRRGLIGFRLIKGEGDF